MKKSFLIASLIVFLLLNVGSHVLVKNITLSFSSASNSTNIVLLNKTTSSYSNTTTSNALNTNKNNKNLENTNFLIKLNSSVNSIITINGSSYLSNNIIRIASGNYVINSTVPNNFSFSYWNYSSNITITNPYSKNTRISILGNAIITANFNYAVVFTQNGLPVSDQNWSISYNNINENSNTNGIIKISLSLGNYIFKILNTTINNTTYTPSSNLIYLNYTNMNKLLSTPITINFTKNYQNNTINSILANKTNQKLINQTINNTLSKKMINTNINNQISVNNSVSNIVSNSSSVLFKNLNMQIALLKQKLPNNSIFIYNSSNSGFNSTENLNILNYSNSRLLSYNQLSNLSSLNQSQFNFLKNNINNIESYGHKIKSFYENLSIPYGYISQKGIYSKAGEDLHFASYDTQGTIFYYNISVQKAIPKIMMSVNGATEKQPNTTSKIYIPLINGEKSSKISISLNGSMARGNSGLYSYEIRFSNGTVIQNTVNTTSLNYQNTFNLSLNQNASITFDTSGNENYSSVDPTLIVIPSSILEYVPITLTNTQTTPTPTQFQDMVTVNSLSYKSYESGNLDNIEFFYFNGTVIPSWIEGSASNTLLNSNTNSNYLSTSTNTIYWLKLANSISAGNTVIVYMGFSANTVDLFNTVNTGEAPELSPTYAEYDDGPSVFNYYNVNPKSTSGWTIAGIAGQKNTAPVESQYNTTNALYANSANGDYMYTPISGFTENSILTFDVYTTGLGDFFFLTNSAGLGQMGRLDGRGGADYSGLATTSTWKSWAAPSSGLDEGRNVWYKFDIVINGNKANDYIGSESDGLSTLGTLANSDFSVTNNGDYIGLVGDGLGSSYITYWNGMIIRAYPPNGVMPSEQFGSIESSNSPVLLLQSNFIPYGTQDTINGTINTPNDQLELFINNTLVSGPSPNSLSYIVCGSQPYITSCESAGNHKVILEDITSGSSANIILNITQSTPTLNISESSAFINTGTSTNIPYSISTVGNQLSATLYINKATVSSSNNQGTVSYSFNNNELYNITLSTPGNGNYLKNNITRYSCSIGTPSSIPLNIKYYAPLCIINNQTSAVSGPFQQFIKINESFYKNYLSYNNNDANFEIFNSTGSTQSSWIESNSTGNITIWSKISTGINANTVYPLYIGFASNTVNLLSNSGVSGIGEFPAATSTYAQYDDGKSVFNNYFNGSSLNGWTTAGTSGDTSSAPSGSPFGTNAFYANGANGDYLYTIANGQSTNSIIEYYTYTQNLDDVFFLVNSQGAGQIARVGNGPGWYGIASASSWTSWTAPPDYGIWSNEWLLMGIMIQNGNAQMFLSTTPGTYGSEIGSNPSNIYSVANNGEYLGFVGDAASSSTMQYMNGMIIRALPPNGVMPSYVEGSPISVSSQSTCTISLSSNEINFGNINPNYDLNTVNSIFDTNSGSADAYMLVYGGNWVGPSQFGVSNTTWSETYNSPFSTSTKLSQVPTNTVITVSPSSSNSIYFGMRVPGGAQSGVYSQNIIIENTC
ncbi:MAG: hypothetical protein ACP5M9_00215 [Candidatus Micrarchaeia archaeon]